VANCGSAEVTSILETTKLAHQKSDLSCQLLSLKRPTFLSSVPSTTIKLTRSFNSLMLNPSSAARTMPDLYNVPAQLDISEFDSHNRRHSMATPSTIISLLFSLRVIASRNLSNSPPIALPSHFNPRQASSSVFSLLHHVSQVQSEQSLYLATEHSTIYDWRSPFSAEHIHPPGCYLV